MKALYVFFVLCLVGLGIAQAQTPVTASVNAAGWKRVAYCNAAAGRGFGKVTLYTTGGAASPYQLDIEWFKDWATSGGIRLSSNSKSAYWSHARLTYDKDTTYIEVNFARDVAAVAIMSDTYGWNVAKPISGPLPNGGGTVRAEARVGKLGIDDHFTVAYNGYVGVGTTTPSERLAVNGTIRAKEIKVEANPWPDYVFDTDYKLPSLEEIRTYIDAHGHLPDVPSADEVAKEGIAVGKMNAILLKKIEEMTLLLIVKDQQLKEQGSAIKSLEQDMLELKRLWAEKM